MRHRTATGKRTAGPPPAFTVDVVLVTPHGRHFGVAAVRRPGARGAGTWVLPWTVPRARETLRRAAGRLVRETAVTEAAWMEQVGALADGSRHPSGSALSVCFVGVIPAGPTHALVGQATWRDADALLLHDARQGRMLALALDALRMRMDFAPIPFHLLPSRFTLSELQQVYELLLGHRLHKASFRRALHASWLVVPTDEWRREGRGRPAQLFRFAPRRRRGRQRGVRFTLL